MAEIVAIDANHAPGINDCLQIVGLGILQRLNYQHCLFMAPSSVLRQGLHSPLCAPWRALNTKPYPAQFW